MRQVIVRGWIEIGDDVSELGFLIEGSDAVEIVNEVSACIAENRDVYMSVFGLNEAEEKMARDIASAL
jgi:hypothetical protein